MRVIFGTVFDKKLFMSKLYKLKDASKPFAGISIKHDMTLDERAELKKLVKKKDELNLENQDLNVSYQVRGPPWGLKIVTVQTAVQTKKNQS